MDIIIIYKKGEITINMTDQFKAIESSLDNTLNVIFL